MNGLDEALNELGMLSSVTHYKLEYLQEVETRAEETKAQTVNISVDSPEDVTISRNSNFVTNITICSQPRLMRSNRLESAAREARLSDNFTHQCGRRHSCPSSHICSFVSPPRSRSRLMKQHPYSHPAHPSLRLPSALTSFKNRTLKSSSRVRFSSDESGKTAIGPLAATSSTSAATSATSAATSAEELTQQLSKIKLNFSSLSLGPELESSQAGLSVILPGNVPDAGAAGPLHGATGGGLAATDNSDLCCSVKRLGIHETQVCDP